MLDELLIGDNALLLMIHWCLLFYFMCVFLIYELTDFSFCFLAQYAHRKCVQRWCNEKGDTTCEICHKVCVIYM